MKKFFVTLMLIFTIVGCGGSGGSGPGGGFLSHNELAARFVNELNFAGVSVELVKSTTLQFGYIVVYDHFYGTYDAYSIEGWHPGIDPLYFLNITDAFFDLVYNPFTNIYTDIFTGVQFEKTQEANKDVGLYAALAEEIEVKKKSENVAERFGLSVERSHEIVRLTMAWQKAGGKDLTPVEQDYFANELLGFSITEAKEAIKAKDEGQSESLDELVIKAAQTNQTTPEHIQELIQLFIGK